MYVHVHEHLKSHCKATSCNRYTQRVLKQNRLANINYHPLISFFGKVCRVENVTILVNGVGAGH